MNPLNWFPTSDAVVSAGVSRQEGRWFRFQAFWCGVGSLGSPPFFYTLKYLCSVDCMQCCWLWATGSAGLRVQDLQELRKKQAIRRNWWMVFQWRFEVTALTLTWCSTTVDDLLQLHENRVLMFLPWADNSLQSEEINPKMTVLHFPKRSLSSFFQSEQRGDKMLRMTKCSWETLCWETMVTKSHRAAPPLSLCAGWTLLQFTEHKQRWSRKDSASESFSGRGSAVRCPLLTGCTCWSCPPAVIYSAATAAHSLTHSFSTAAAAPAPSTTQRKTL